MARTEHGRRVGGKRGKEGQEGREAIVASKGYRVESERSG